MFKKQFLFIMVTTGTAVAENMHELIASYKKAYDEFSMHQKEMYPTYFPNFYYGKIHHATYPYSFTHQQAHDAFDNYMHTKEKLNSAVLASFFGDGFFIGIITACIRNYCHVEKKIEYPFIFLLLAASIKTASMQKKLRDVHYVALFNDLKTSRYFDYWAATGGFLATLASSLYSFIGTEYSIDAAKSLIPLKK